VIALFILHAWLRPDGAAFCRSCPHRLSRNRIAGLGHRIGQYLARFANNYVTMYAGLPPSSSRWCFCIFIAAFSSMGGE